MHVQRRLCTRTAGVVAGFVVGVLVFAETWHAGTVFTHLAAVDAYKGMVQQSSGHTHTQHRMVVTRESNGCLCIDHQTGQLLNLTTGKTLTRAECPAARNATFFPAKITKKHFTALASFPASGNTWTRHLIEYISGILTGSVYNDGTLAKQFKGENARPDHRLIAIKTHNRYGMDKVPYDNVILLVRTPTEAIASYFNYAHSRSHTQNAKPSMFNSTAWTKHVNGRTQNWRNFDLSFLNDYHGRMMVLSYSRLQTDFFNEVCRLGNFLNLTISYETLWCASEKREGKFHRKSIFDYKSMYTEQEMEGIDAAERDVKEAIVKRFGANATDGMF